MPTREGDASILARSNGQALNGEVFLDDFDRGVIETLGAKALSYTPEGRPNRQREKFAYFWELDTVKPPPGMPGVPIIFGPSEDVFERTKIPYILIVPGGAVPAMQRWHPAMVQYRAPAPTAREVQVGNQHGFDRYQQRQQAHPFDITYTLKLITKRRSSPRAQGNGAGAPAVPVVEGGSANALLREVLRVYPAYCGVNVLDTAGDYRTYSAFMEGISPADEVTEVGDRVVGFALTLRVEGELDLDPETEAPAVTRRLTMRAASV
jgi:hypothetical protein